MSVGVLDHFNVRTRDLDTTVRFYERALGLERGPRPDFPVPGAWLYSEGRPVVHLVDVSGTEEQPGPGSGVIHHVAFESRGFDAMCRRLDEAGYTYEARDAPGGEIRQVFVRDPNGVLVELNFVAPDF